MPAMSTLGASAAPHDLAVVVDRSPAAMLRSAVLPVGTAIALMSLALLALLSSAWIHAAMAASGGAAAGATLEQSQQLSDQTVHELLFGPGTWLIAMPDGSPLFSADEIAHLQDVRAVLLAFLGLALLGGVLVGWALVRRRDAGTWRAVGRGGAILAVGLVVVGAFAAIAFGVAFELFHRLLFPGGNWAFDPARSNLVRLYPLAFWQLSAAAFGMLGIVAGGATWWIGRRQARRADRSAAPATGQTQEEWSR